MNSYRTDFENMRISTLESIHNGIVHEVELLQEKMSGDMGIPTFYNILPRNFDILPIERCSVHDIELLKDLHKKRFKCFWTLEEKKAAEKNDKSFDARFRFYSYLDILNDNEVNDFFNKCQSHNQGKLMTSHDIIQTLMVNPNFIKEVMA